MKEGNGRSATQRGRTIRDFGDQWLRYRDNEGYYGSLDLFSDMLSPFIKPDDIKGCRVAEIGSGTGRIVNMLLETGAQQVIAIEPSDAFEVLCQNIRQPEKVTCLKVLGEELPPDGNVDYVFSIGVLHHIPDPHPVVKAAFRALRPGGRFLVWLYGAEGNALYLTFVKPLREVTKRLPHVVLAGLVSILYWPLVFYVRMCHWWALPLRGYFLSVFGKMTPEKQRLIIYDQLKPAYAKYYTKSEAEELLLAGEFEEVRTHHRHGYSWTVIGTKPKKSEA